VKSLKGVLDGLKGTLDLPTIQELKDRIDGFKVTVKLPTIKGLKDKLDTVKGHIDLPTIDGIKDKFDSIKDKINLPDLQGIKGKLDELTGDIDIQIIKGLKGRLDGLKLNIDLPKFNGLKNKLISLKGKLDLPTFKGIQGIIGKLNIKFDLPNFEGLKIKIDGLKGKLDLPTFKDLKNKFDGLTFNVDLPQIKGLKDKITNLKDQVDLPTLQGLKNKLDGLKNKFDFKTFKGLKDKLDGLKGKITLPSIKDLKDKLDGVNFQVDLPVVNGLKDKFDDIKNKFDIDIPDFDLSWVFGKPACRDRRTSVYCKTLRRMKKCSKSLLAGGCKKTCGLCDEDKTPEAPEVDCQKRGYKFNKVSGKCEGSCQDSPICSRVRGRCDDFEFGTKTCPQTCGFCGFEACEVGFEPVRTSGKWKCQPVPETVTEEPSTTLSGPITAVPIDYVFPDENGEDQDDKYFRIKDEPTPKPKPKELGMTSTLIEDQQITASSFVPGSEPMTARPLSVGGWQPDGEDVEPYLQIDLQRPISVHGFGSLGGYNDDCWVSGYHVHYSDDGENFQPLVDTSKVLADGTNPPRFFVGNNDRNTWKRHCVHKYYGEPIDMKVVRFYPVTDSQGNKVEDSPFNPANGCMAMRVELYGFRDAEDPQLVKAMERDVWTRQPTGCTCYFDRTRNDCACCEQGGCQCSEMFPHQCVQCGYGSQCGIPELPHWLFLRDGWTTVNDNCQCRYDPTLFNCACCNEKRGGVQCPREEHSNQCVQAGTEKIQCGKKEHIFGRDAYCVPKTCPPQK